MNDWRKWAAGLLAVATMTAGGWLPGSEAYAAEPQEKIQIYIDGQEQSFDPAAVMREGRVYLPMKALYEALGAQVSWDDEKREASAAKGGQTARLPLDKPYAYINGVLTALDAPAFEAGGRAMVPLRFAGESLGLSVAWDAAQGRVDVVSEKPEEPASKDGRPTGGGKEGKDEGTLAYEEAARLAVRNNQGYYNAQTALGKVEDANDRLYITPGTYSAKLIQQKDSLNLQQKWLEQQLGLAAQGLSVNTRSQMDQISMLEEKLALLEKTKKYQDYALEMAQLKFDNGMLSRLELEAARSKAQETDKSIELCKTSIEASYMALNAATGQDLGLREKLEYAFAYKPVTEADLKDKLRTGIKDDPYLWYTRQELGLEDYKLQTYDYMTDYYGGGLSYPVAQMNLAAARNNAKEVEKNLNDQIQLRYNKLRQLELSIQQKELSLDDALRSQGAVQSKFDAGMATKAELMQARLLLPSAIQEIRELQLQHAQLRYTFDQPYLQPNYYSGGSAS